MKHLRYFDALARHHHFGRAAEHCAISQPALSVQIRELETLVGAPLVERGNRQISLTSLGEAFLERVQAILRGIDDLGDFVRAPGGQMSGRLRLGVIPTVAPYLLPDIIKALRISHPDIDITPREAITRKLIDDLEDARLDAAIVALPVSEPGLHEAPLFDETFVLVRAPEDADKPVPGPDGLREMDLLLLEEGHCFRDQALEFCDLSRPVAARRMMEGSSLSTLVQMVGAGIGVTLLPEMAIAIETRSADVSCATLPEPRPRRTIGMVWRRTSPLAAQFDQIAATLRAAAQARGCHVAGPASAASGDRPSGKT